MSPYAADTACPQCPRQREYSISPLVEVYWKRLIVDEGYVTIFKPEAERIFLLT